jgi:Peptidase A4 family
MPQRTVRNARVLMAAAALLLPVASADAATTLSSNWAGYVVTPKRSGTKFKTVSGTWVVPQGTCGSGSSDYSATWVGIGGYRSSSQALEQTGTAFDCTADGTARYSAWYELVPDVSHDGVGDHRARGARQHLELALVENEGHAEPGWRPLRALRVRTWGGTIVTVGGRHELLGLVQRAGTVDRYPAAHALPRRRGRLAPGVSPRRRPQPPHH